MIIESINDQDAINTIDKDIKAMSKAIASLKKSRTIAKKVKVAISSGRITEERGHELLSSLHEYMRTDIIIIQDRGMGLGQGDIGNDHDRCADILAQHYINQAK